MKSARGSEPGPEQLDVYRRSNTCITERHGALCSVNVGFWARSRSELREAERVDRVPSELSEHRVCDPIPARLMTSPSDLIRSTRKFRFIRNWTGPKVFPAEPEPEPATVSQFTFSRWGPDPQQLSCSFNNTAPEINLVLSGSGIRCRSDPLGAPLQPEP